MGRIINLYRAKLPMQVFVAGVFCAGAATLISALWLVVVLLWASAPFDPILHWYETPIWYQVPMAVLSMSRATCVPAGLFGFVSGVFGRLYLRFRSRDITSRTHLTAESAVVGSVLSACFPLFLLPTRRVPVADLVNWKVILFSVAVGCPVFILYAVFFHKSLLGSGSSSPGPTTHR